LRDDDDFEFEKSFAKLLLAADEYVQESNPKFGREVEYKKGAMIFQQDDQGDAMYIVQKGSVEISIISDEGKKLSLNVMKAGSVFGEIAALDQGIRTASAIAQERVVATRYTRNDLLNLIKLKPEIALDTINLLCSRIRWVSQQVEELAMLDIQARLANRLLILHRKFAEPDGKLKMSQSDLADFLGVTRESINKVLQGWRAKGAIKLSRGSIQVINAELLVSIANAD